MRSRTACIIVFAVSASSVKRTATRIVSTTRRTLPMRRSRAPTHSFSLCVRVGLEEFLNSASMSWLIRVAFAGLSIATKYNETMLRIAPRPSLK